MNLFLYPKLAFTGMVKNRRLYVPFFIACSSMMMIFYITVFLSRSEFVNDLPGGSVMHLLLTAGWIVMLVFSSIFLFYTNSFLIKRRKTEFGLYNILGMGKMNIARIIAWETFFTWSISLIVGISCGILFSKLSELLLVKMMGGENVYAFNVDPVAVILEIIAYAALFASIFVNSLRQVRTSGAIQLLHSQNAGEKPPKVNWVAAVLGVLILGAAYYIALTIKDPVVAVMAFLGAVVLVIIATYLLFIAGSVALCRVLQKNKDYYYKTRHFVSTSQMVYRMRKNGAGLASICILCTMVLVTISTTTCLYFGSEDMIRREYPRDIRFSIKTEDYGKLTDVKDKCINAVGSAGYEMSDVTEYRYLDYYYNERAYYVDDKLADKTDKGARGVAFSFVPLSEFNRVTGQDAQLSADEAIMIIDRYTADRFYLDKIPDYLGGFLNVKDYVRDFPTVEHGEIGTQVLAYRTAVVPDEIFEKVHADRLKYNTENKIGGVHDDDNNGEIIGGYVQPAMSYYYGFNLPECSDDEMSEIFWDIYGNLRDTARSDRLDPTEYSGGTIASTRTDYYAVYSGFFFLGIVFSAVFVFSAALIMYYKQLSEGYEDKARFDILRKVGMSLGEVRSTINSQVLTVFFLPLAAAGVHTLFAFPILSKLLSLFGDMNVGFLAVVAVLCFAVFGVVYTAVYFVTSKAYYKIVS